MPEGVAEQVAERGIVPLGSPPYERILGKDVEPNLLVTIFPFLLVFAGLVSLVLALGAYEDLPLLDAYGRLETAGRIGVLASLGAMFLGLGVAVARVGRQGRRLRSKARAVIGRRRDAVLRPQDRGVYFVDLLDAMDQRPHRLDVGFLSFDRERGLLLYEGGCERWAIRREQIALCWVEEKTSHRVSTLGSPGTTHRWHCLQLTVRNEVLGERERALLVYRPGLLSMPSRRLMAWLAAELE